MEVFWSTCNLPIKHPKIKRVAFEEPKSGNFDVKYTEFQFLFYFIIFVKFYSNTLTLFNTHNGKLTVIFYFFLFCFTWVVDF